MNHNSSLIISKDKKRLASVLKNNPERITLVKACRKDDYAEFKRIKLDDIKTDYVTCCQCNDKELIKYITKNGAGNLINHQNANHKSRSNTPSTSKQQSMESFAMKSITLKDKYSMADMVAICCANEFRPFTLTEGKAFIDMIQFIIGLVTKRGLIDAATLLPSGDSVKNHIDSIDKKLRVKLIKEMETVNYVNCTSDHWKEDYSKRDYMAITVHYSDPKDGRLISRVIGSFEVEKKTALVTERQFAAHLGKFGLDKKVKLIVTDNGANMVKAFDKNSKYDWIGCASHNLALVQKYSFGDELEDDETDPIPSVRNLLDTSKKLVTYVKQSCINSDLAIRLKQECPTRWDTNYDMLKSIFDDYDQLLKIPETGDYIDKINYNLLKSLVELLKPLKIIRKKFSVEDAPTFHLISVTYDRILDIMQHEDGDHQMILLMKKRIIKFLKSKFIVTPIHIVATFISPCFRSHKFSDHKLREESEKLLDDLLTEVPESEPEKDSDVPIVINQYRNSIFDMYMDQPSNPRNEGSEIQRYLNHPLTAEDIKKSPLEFWSENQKKYPKLSNLAFWLLSAPATNNSSERVFSAAGNFVTPHRARLNPDTVDKLLFIRSNSDLYKSE